MLTKTMANVLLEGENTFTFWALSSWGDSSQMGSLSGVTGEARWYISPTAHPGIHTLHVRAFDVAGNQAAATPLTFQVHGTPPRIQLWYTLHRLHVSRKVKKWPNGQSLLCFPVLRLP